MNKEYQLELVRGAIAGDKQALDQLLEAKSRDVLYIAGSISGGRGDAEDVAQEAIIRIYTHITQLRVPETFDSWMYRVVSSVSRNMNAKMNTKRIISIDEYSYDVPEEDREFLPHEFAEDEVLREIVLEACNELKPRYREVVVARYYSNLKFREIASALNLSEKQVDGLYRRAIKKMTKNLEKKIGRKIDRTGVLSVLPIPVLSHIFEQEANIRISSEQAHQICRKAIVSAEAGAVGAGSVGFGIAGTMTKTSTSAVIKGIGGLAVAVVIGGIAYNSLQDQSFSEETATSPVKKVKIVEAKPEEPVEVMGLEPEVEKADAIITIEDLLGEASAQLLYQYREQGTDAETWQEFLQAENAQLEYESPGYDYVNRVYQITKQDKKLIIIDKLWTDGKLEIRYRFTDQAEELPDGVMIEFSYNDW